MKKKLLILWICVPLAIIFSVAAVFAVGSRYTLHTNIFLGTDTVPKAEVRLSDENVARMTDVRMENGELIFEFEALNPGKTSVNISYVYGDDVIPMHERTFDVNSLGTLIDFTEGIIKFNGVQYIVYAALAVLFVFQFVMLWMFTDYRKKGDFSYPMIACGGIGLYNLVMFAYILYKLLNNVIDSVSTLLMLITETGLLFLFGLTPVMLVISVMLAVSNIWLIRNEGRRLLWGIQYPESLRLILIYLIAYFECMLLSTVTCTYLATKYTPAPDRDYIIILGCGIRKDGGLTPLLKGRVDSAVAFGKKQYEQTGKHAVYVPSGGQGDDEVISESEAMKNYLLGIGIPPEQIILEDKSVNTMQNMQFSKKVIEDHVLRRRVFPQKQNRIFISTLFCVNSSACLSTKNGII